MATGSSASCVLNSAGISKEWIISGFQTACNCLLKCHSQRIKLHDLGYACLHPQCGGYLCCFVCFNCLGISDMSILYLIKSTPALFPFNSFPIPTTACPSQSQVLCDLNPLILLSSASMYMCVRPFTKAWAVSQELNPWNKQSKIPTLLFSSRHKLPKSSQLKVGLHDLFFHLRWKLGWLNLVCSWMFLSHRQFLNDHSEA